MTRKLDSKALREYEERELAFIQGQSAKIRERGHIEEWTDLYPDIAPQGSSAFGRGGVPLNLLLLLYERVAFYVPPTSQRMLEDRWGLPGETVFELCEAGLLVPLIGHPTDYNRPHFAPILSLRPPSVWARGLGILRSLDLEDKLLEASRVLPIEEIATLPWIRAHWQRHFPNLKQNELTKAIRREVQTLYADLWVFGDDLIARELHTTEDPDTVVRRLMLVNEVRTYPKLFGLGGTAHYSQKVVEREPLLLEDITHAHDVLPPELEEVARGLGIDLRTMTAREIVDFHASEAGRSLRYALRSFEREIVKIAPATYSREAVYFKLDRFRQALLDAKKHFSDPRRIRVMQRTEHRVRGLLRLGGLALGALISQTLGASWLITFGSASVGERVVERLLPRSVPERVVRKAIAQRFSPGIAHLWQARSRIREGPAGK